MKSIMQDVKECWVCGSPYVETHHIYKGVANRKLSDKDGCTIYLCAYHHRGNRGIHFDPLFDKVIKATCQVKWQEFYNKTEGDFRARYGKSYL